MYPRFIKDSSGKEMLLMNPEMEKLLSNLPKGRNREEEAKKKLAVLKQKNNKDVYDVIEHFLLIAIMGRGCKDKSYYEFFYDQLQDASTSYAEQIANNVFGFKLVVDKNKFVRSAKLIDKTPIEVVNTNVLNNRLDVEHKINQKRKNVEPEILYSQVQSLKPTPPSANSVISSSANLLDDDYIQWVHKKRMQFEETPKNQLTTWEKSQIWPRIEKTPFLKPVANVPKVPKIDVRPTQALLNSTPPILTTTDQPVVSQFNFSSEYLLNTPSSQWNRIEEANSALENALEKSPEKPLQNTVTLLQPPSQISQNTDTQLFFRAPASKPSVSQNQVSPSPFPELDKVWKGFYGR